MTHQQSLDGTQFLVDDRPNFTGSFEHKICQTIEIENKPEYSNLKYGDQVQFKILGQTHTGFFEPKYDKILIHLTYPLVNLNL